MSLDPIWYEHEPNRSKLATINEDLLASLKVILCAPFIGQNVCSQFSLADVVSLLNDDATRDAQHLSYILADAPVSKRLAEGPGERLATGMVQMALARLRGDGRVLHKMSVDNPFGPYTKAFDVYHNLPDGVYLSQAKVLGFPDYILTSMIAMGFLEVRQETLPRTEPKLYKRRSHTRKKKLPRSAPHVPGWVNGG